MRKKLLITKRGVLTRRDENKLTKAGYVVIEVDDPSCIIVYDEFGDLDRDVILSCALQALDYGNDTACRLAFGNIIRKAMLEKKKKLTDAQ